MQPACSARRAGGQAQCGQVVLDRDRPADQIGHRHAALQRRACDALLEQAGQVCGALAVPGQDDRHVGRDARQEEVERLADVLIGGIECLVRRRIVGQESAEGRLAIFRCPDLRRAVERTGHALDEQPGAGLAVRIVERGVPGVAVDVARRVDEKDSERRRCSARTCGGPGRGLGRSSPPLPATFAAASGGCHRAGSLGAPKPGREYHIAGSW